jgi:hypothetical protein
VSARSDRYQNPDHDVGQERLNLSDGGEGGCDGTARVARILQSRNLCVGGVNDGGVRDVGVLGEVNRCLRK